MATPFVTNLLPLDTYAAASDGHEGNGRQSVGRTRFTFTLKVAKVTSITVVIQAAAVNDDDEYATVGTFNGGAITTAGTYTLVTFGSPTDFTWEGYYNYARAKVTAQTGDATAEATMAGAFLDPTVSADKVLLSKELREWTDGLTRTVEQAERDVRALLLAEDEAGSAWGVMDIFGTAPWANDEVRAMIAEQSDWLYQRRMMARAADTSGDSGSRRLSYRDMDDIAPGLLDRASKLRPHASAYWRGR